MSKGANLTERARRLVAQAYESIALAKQLRRRAEELEKETWKLVQKLEGEGRKGWG